MLFVEKKIIFKLFLITVCPFIIFINGGVLLNETLQSQIVILSNFTGIGHISKGIVLPIGPRPNLTAADLAEKKAKSKLCKEKHTPPAACGFRNADNLYGRWYVSSIPGLPRGSPICEKVDFYPGENQHSFNKVLQLHLKNGTWFKQVQNGTIVAPGTISLELDLEKFGIIKKPGCQLTYTMIDFDPNHYITAFFCFRGKPMVPVLTRSRVPSMDVWAKIFAGVLKAGCKLTWMDLFCHPSQDKDFGLLSSPISSAMSSYSEEVDY